MECIYFFVLSNFYVKYQQSWQKGAYNISFGDTELQTANYCKKSEPEQHEDI